MPGSGPAGLRGQLAAGLLCVALASTAALATPAAAARAMPRRASAAAAAPGTITTIAGGVGGPGPATGVSVAACGTENDITPCGMTFSRGRLYLTDIGDNGSGEGSDGAGSVIRAISLRTGRLTTPAGNGTSFAYGALGDGGPATAAGLSVPGDVNVDSAGNQLIADSDSQVRVVAARTGTFYGVAMTAGNVYPVAGSLTLSGPPTQGAAATDTALSPVSVAADAAGDLFISNLFRDNGEFTGEGAWIVPAASGTLFGEAMTAGHIYQLAAPVAGLGAIRVDHHGNLVDANGSTVKVVAAATGTFYGQPMTAGKSYVIAGGGSGGRGDGGPAVQGTLNGASGLAIDRAGDLIIADSGDGRVRLVAEQTGRRYGQQLTAGDIYTVAGGGTSLLNGAPALQADLKIPRAVAVDRDGGIAVAYAFSRRVRLVAARSGRFYGQRMAAGHIYAIAGNGATWLSGNGGPASRAQLHPVAEAVDHAGNLLIADGGLPSERSELRVVAARAGTFYGQQMTAGDIYTVAGAGPEGYSGDGGPATLAQFQLTGENGAAMAMTVDPAGNVVFDDAGHDRVRVVAERAGTFYGQRMTAGDIYTIAGGGTGASLGNGGPATRAEIFMDEGTGLATDARGNIVVADASGGEVRVVAAAKGTFYGRKMKAGHIYRVAGDGSPESSGDGGPARKAALHPASVAVDARGDLVIADTMHGRVRVVAAAAGTFYGQRMTKGDIYTVAGNGQEGFSGDGGPATSAELIPNTVAVDGSGNLVIASQLSGLAGPRVRVVAARTGTFYGVPMTANDIYTVAGGDTRGFTGDGGPATGADFSILQEAISSGTSLLVADSGTLRVRMIQG